MKSYVTDNRETQTFDPLPADEITIVTGEHKKLVIDALQRFKSKVIEVTDSTVEYTINDLIEKIDDVIDETKSIEPIAVADRTEDISQVKMDRVDYRSLLNKTEIDRLDNVKEV